MSVSTHADSAKADTYREMARRYIEEVWDKNNVETEEELLAVDWTDHMPLPGCANGRAGHRQAVQLMHDMAPDMRFYLNEIVIEGDLVIDRWTAHGTFTGKPMYGFPPTGKKWTMTGLDLHRVRDGKFVDLWHEESTAALVEQLGMAPEPGTGGLGIIKLTARNVLHVAKYKMRGGR
ncbi:ester cyclase [Saccharothrix sp. NRRL B-16314]|uniref:ester cyclase n=1 Tax=Saccharothrix sp. NRRL B-16314 TaxID=1463825 RepID=UPI0018CC5CC6|nr:ester cyclase [Saccharothrix sp. NRRL B-16314]